MSRTALSQKGFGGGCLGVHELLSVAVDGVRAVVFVESENGAVGGTGFGELVAWFQWKSLV